MSVFVPDTQVCCQWSREARVGVLAVWYRDPHLHKDNAAFAFAPPFFAHNLQ
jgi:hypothetical protein